MEYSIVIPVYNEFNSIPILYNAIRNTMDPLKQPYEIIFINDGSAPRGMEYLEEALDKKVARIINLEKHLGQTVALATGFKEAQGKIVISMDGDLQDDPAHIPGFIKKLQQGFDAVCGYRINRKDKLNKIILSKIGNFIQKVLFRTELHDIACTYRAYKKECIKKIKLIRNGYHRYIPIILIREGYKVTELPIVQASRLYGQSNYSLFSKIAQITVSFLYLVFDMLIKRI